LSRTKIITLLLLFCTELTAQSASVEKSIYGVQAGFAGAWLYNEFRLSNAMALRSEIGLNMNFDESLYRGASTRGFLIAPEINIQPRWYYNLERRAVKGKDIKQNNGNFLAFKANVSQPTLLTQQKITNVEYSYQMRFLATWGIRRNIGERFNYELGLGGGYQYGHSVRSDGFGKIYGPAIDLHIRVGYKF
jgi:hypothetical protein